MSETMSAGTEPHEKGEVIPDDSNAAFQCEDEALNDGWALRKEGAELEATIKAIQSRVEANAAASPIMHHHETMDAFLSTFLFQMGMTETLECFQSEWAELLQRGLVDAQQVEVVPDVYVEILQLHRKLKNIQREIKEYKEASSAAAEILEKAQKARDIQRMHHQRVLVEKNRLIEELRKMKIKCSSYESELKRQYEKYQAAVKQTVLMSLERDKAVEVAKETEEAGFNQWSLQDLLHLQITGQSAGQACSHSEVAFVIIYCSLKASTQ